MKKNKKQKCFRAMSKRPIDIRHWGIGTKKGDYPT